jgi:hypothetical protein
MKDEELRIQLHIEAVRNYMQACSIALLVRGESHDRSKLSEPELTTYCQIQPLLRSTAYGSEEYKSACKQLGPALKHHQASNRHHPEFFEDGIRGMNLIDILEMFCDWQASSERAGSLGVYNSIDICQKRFGFSDELAEILKNTADWIGHLKVQHRAEES